MLRAYTVTGESLVFSLCGQARASGGSTISGQYRHTQKKVKVPGYHLFVSFLELFISELSLEVLSYAFDLRGHHSSMSTEY